MDFLFIKVYTCNLKSRNDLWYISNDQIEVHVLYITPQKIKKLESRCSRIYMYMKDTC